jgi:hypothetical protein
MDFLLTKLESVKTDINVMDEDNEDTLPPYYSASVLATWSKISNYYELTDNSPIYRMAVALHRAYKFDYFRQKWWKRDDTIKAAEKDLAVYYDAFVSVIATTTHNELPDTSPPSSPVIDDEFEAWGHTTDRPCHGKKGRKVESEWEICIKQPLTR